MKSNNGRDEKEDYISACVSSKEHSFIFSCSHSLIMTDVIVGSGTSASQGSGTCFSDGLSRGCGESSVVLSFLRGICILLSITVYRYMWVSTTFWKTDISSIRDIETSYVFPISAPGHLSQRGNKCCKVHCT